MFNKVCIYIGLRKSLSMLKIKPVSYLMHEFFKVFNKSTTLLKRVAHNLLLAFCTALIVHTFLVKGLLV